MIEDRPYVLSWHSGLPERYCPKPCSLVPAETYPAHSHFLVEGGDTQMVLLRGSKLSRTLRAASKGKYAYNYELMRRIEKMLESLLPEGELVIPYRTDNPQAATLGRLVTDIIDDKYPLHPTSRRVLEGYAGVEYYDPDRGGAFGRYAVANGTTITIYPQRRIEHDEFIALRELTREVQRG